MQKIILHSYSYHHYEPWLVMVMTNRTVHKCMRLICISITIDSNVYLYPMMYTKARTYQTGWMKMRNCKRLKLHSGLVERYQAMDLSLYHLIMITISFHSSSLTMWYYTIHSSTRENNFPISALLWALSLKVQFMILTSYFYDIFQ